MQAKEISGELAHTYNLDNFENVRVTVSLTATVEPGEDVRAAYDKLFQELGEQLFDKLKHAVEALKR